jgi:hypothetical protein
VWEEWSRRARGGGPARPLDSISKEFDSRYNVVGGLKKDLKGKAVGDEEAK